MDLETATTPRPIGDDRFSAEIPDGWQQGRGAYGGLALGLLARAFAHVAPDRPLRVLQADLCGPVLPGPVEIRVERLREGSGLTTLAGRVLQHGAVAAHATGAMGRAREGSWRAAVMPEVPPWTDVAVIAIQCPPFPAFSQHFEYRPLRLPFDGAGAEALGWIRPLHPGAARDAAFLAAVADVWWPSAFGRLDRMRPMATIAYVLQLAEGLDGLDPAAPLLHVGRSDVARDGYVIEARTLWGADGRLVAHNQQTMVILG